MYTAHNGRFIQRRTNYLCPGGGEVGTVSPNSYMRAMVDSRCYFVQLFRLSSLPTIATRKEFSRFFTFLSSNSFAEEWPILDKYSRNNVPRKNYRRLRDIVTYIIFLETRRRNQQNAKYISQKSLHLRAWHTHLIFPKACLSRRPQAATRREKFNRGTILVRLNVTAARTRYRRDIQGGEERNRAKHGGWREERRVDQRGVPRFPQRLSRKVSRSLVRPFIGDVTRLKVSRRPRLDSSRPHSALLERRRGNLGQACSLFYDWSSVCLSARVSPRFVPSTPSGYAQSASSPPSLSLPRPIPDDRVGKRPITLIEKKRKRKKGCHAKSNFQVGGDSPLVTGRHAAVVTGTDWSWSPRNSAFSYWSLPALPPTVCPQRLDAPDLRCLPMHHSHSARSTIEGWGGVCCDTARVLDALVRSLASLFGERCYAAWW